MHLKIKYILFFAVTLLSLSCSTKKNTTITRSYHNLTSHYNILFNGKESYKMGILKLQETYQDDFSKILPVFLYTKKEALDAISPEMDRSIQKATKLISMHSLTAKPKIKSEKELNQKQKEFLGKKEYNKWVDEAYLLMGKSHFHKQEYTKAKETFNYILNNFTGESSVFEAKLWLARLANEEGRFRESNDILTSLSKNILFPKDLKGDLYATWADYFMKQELYSDAIVNLKKSLDHPKRKVLKIRYNYILAQLYAKTGDNNKALEYYDRVVRMNPPYQMTFSAKISRALVYQKGAVDRKDIEKQLNKMLKDDKNIEYQDQIYFALGQLYYKDNNKQEAIRYYRLAMVAGQGDEKQRARTSITLADLYYSEPDYSNAQAYYDSAVAIITADYPDYQIIYAKSVSLTNLVDNINIVNFEDSVLALSLMNKPELEALIDNLIEKEVKADEERRQRDFEAQSESRENLEDLSTTTTISGVREGNSWYFYNTTAKTVGHKEFVKVWGNRKLEDNWRRKNRTSLSFTEIQAAEGDTTDKEKVEGKEKEKSTDRKSRKYYLQDIPFTDSAKAGSNTRIADGLFNMGEIYGDELKDYTKATDSYESLLRRYPGYVNRLQVYYKLYSIAKNNGDTERESKYQRKIINEYPNSSIAKMLTNPNYLEEIKAKEQKVFKDYEQTLLLYRTGKYSQVESRSGKAMTDYPGHILYPKFDYLHTVTAGLKKDTLEFVSDLQKLLARYPRSEMSENVSLMIAYLQNKKPEIVEIQNQIIAEELFVASNSEVHFFVYIVPSHININQLIFNIINFNLDNFDELKLDVKKVSLNTKNTLCTVQRFDNGEKAMEYFRKIILDSEIFRDVEKQIIVPVVISQTNYNKLLETGKTDQYQVFFRNNYR